MNAFAELRMNMEDQDAYEAQLHRARCWQMMLDAAGTTEEPVRIDRIGRKRGSNNAQSHPLSEDDPRYKFGSKVFITPATGHN